MELTKYERDRERASLDKIYNGLAELAMLKRTEVRSDEVGFLLFVQKHLQESKSQLLQDLFVMYELQEKPGGYFVEFGATNGVDSSNSYLMETRYSWNGILAEPGRIWHEQLKKNRRCRIDERCVWRESGAHVEFNQVTEPELSTIHAYSDTDRYSNSRTKGDRYLVETISLNELLQEHGAPAEIDYLSIDTEGSELDILSAFDFDRYRIKIVTCEHNFTEARDKICALLTSKGYVRKFLTFSQNDDWYVKR
ncbi:MAG: FkbM family methyltransferase [Nitrospira sp.]|nr:FkbM family methyltransferase [Nitrospira sp.]